MHESVAVQRPDLTHVVSGVVEAHGANEIASSEARLKATVTKLERTASGGVAYELSILIDEPPFQDQEEEA
jgi:hypothetical protein